MVEYVYQSMLAYSVSIMYIFIGDRHYTIDHYAMHHLHKSVLLQTHIVTLSCTHSVIH